MPPIPNKFRPSQKPIVIRFNNRKAKVNVLRNAWKLKNSKTPDNQRRNAIYINEHLTAKNNAIAKEARKLRSDGKLIKTWVKDCKVFIKFKSANNDERIMLVKHMNDFQVFK